MGDQSVSLLFVEDDLLDQRTFARFVAAEGLNYDYRTAGSVAAAGKLLTEQHFDIIVADHQLGDGTSLELLASEPNTPLIVITGAGDERTAVQALKAGAYDYLIKDQDRHYLTVLPVTVANALRHKQTEDALHLVRFERSVAGVFRADVNGQLHECNAAFARVLGYETREHALADGNFWERFNPEDIRRLQHRLSAEKFLSNYELATNGVGNDSICVLMNLSLLSESDLGLPIVEGTLIDITLRKHAEEALREHEHQLASVLATVPDIILVLDAQGGYRSAFTGDEKQFMYPSHELQGKTIREALPAVLSEEVQEVIDRALASGDMQRFEYSLTLNGKPHWYSARVMRFKWQGEPCALWVARDVTERRRNERKEHFRRVILEMVARNEPLEQTLSQLTLMYEDLHAGVQISIWSLVGDEPLCLAAPARLNDMVTQISASAGVNIVTAAASRNEAMLVDDIQSCPLWAPYRDLAIRHHVIAAWSAPIRTGGKEVATINMWYTTPAAHDTDLSEMAHQLVTIAIDQYTLLKQLTSQAQHDALTELPNRFLFEDRLHQAILRAERSKDSFALLFIDLDRFKWINDTLGHDIGDMLLQLVAARLSTRIRKKDTLARMGGDEFALILEDMDPPMEARRVAEEILLLLKSPFHAQGHELHATASIGIAHFPVDGDDAVTLLRHADSAMYHAKSMGKDRYHRFSPEIGSRESERLTMVNQLHHALERKELELHYQPRVDLRRSTVTSLEALLRWNNTLRGPIAPESFIPIAEDSGLIVPISDWVTFEACKQVATWQQSDRPARPVAVNVSALQFGQPDFIDKVTATLEANHLDACWLELEVTESVVMHDIDAVAHRLRQLHDLGIAISIDDFGTGYSSLSYLRRLPIDCLKIDRSFVAGIDNEGSSGDQSAALLQAIVTLAHSLDLKVIAEGVETKKQVAVLRSVTCDEAQGYYFERPLSLMALESCESFREGKVSI